MASKTRWCPFFIDVECTVTKRILGISAYYHDSAAALIVDGVIVAAAQEERFTRKKHDPDFPRKGKAVEYYLAEAGLSVAELDYVVHEDNAIQDRADEENGLPIEAASAPVAKLVPGQRPVLQRHC